MFGEQGVEGGADGERREVAGGAAPRVLVADDEEAMARVLARLLGARGCVVDIVQDGAEALERLAHQPYDVLLTDVQMPHMSGIELLAHVRRERLPCEVIIMTAFADVETAVSAVQAGAYTFLAKPFVNNDAVAVAVRNATKMKRLREEARDLQRRLASGQRSPILARSAAMQEVFRIIAGVAPTDASVLILGETGTGKELAASAVHEASRRSSMLMATLNCGSIPRELVESELFGHVKGAFTSAHRDRVGVFEAAHKGTVFLDEIGDLPLDAQAKLLRVLQSGEVRAVGSDTTRQVDVRIIAATNVDLKAATVAGTFRQDLYYRLNVISLVLPPLRARGEDVILLARHFLARYAAGLERQVPTLSDAAAACLRAYPWPGNVRQLEHEMERAVLLETTDVIQIDSLSADVRARSMPPPPPPPGSRSEALPGYEDLLALPYAEAKQRMASRFKSWYAGELLDAAEGNVSEAARRAGLDRSNFRKMLRESKN